MSRNILKSSVQNASFSIIFQILFRCITFILNAFIIRTVGQEVLGIMNVRLLLLESTILFLSKEPIIKACLSDTKSHNWAQIINQVWLSVPMTGLLSLVLVYIWLYVLSPTNYQTQYELGCYAIAVSCIIEQMIQPVILVSQSYCFVKLKVVFDTIYVISRTVIFVYCVVLRPNQAIIAFSIAQVASAVILCFLYYGFFAWFIIQRNKSLTVPKSSKLKTSLIFDDMDDFPFTSMLDFVPGFMENSDRLLNKDLCILTISFAKQSVIKQVLTEGERYVMTISPVLTFSEQSIYDIVNNLGSLAARFVFRPIEESAYFYFTQMVKRDEPITNQNQQNIAESAIVLKQLCTIVASIGLIVVVFGQSYSYTLLYLYGGHKLVDDSLPVHLLQWHSFAIILLAINGVTEGYVFATMNNRQLDKYNYIMVIFSISFLVISYVFTNIMGPVGFILANCINMLARITHSVVYIFNKYENTNHRPLDGLIPSYKFVVALIISGIVTKVSEKIIAGILLHIIIGGLCLVATLGVWAIENKTLLKLGYDKYKKRVSTKSD